MRKDIAKHDQVFGDSSKQHDKLKAEEAERTREIKNEI